MIVGKTTMPEFGILPVTEPRRFGPTRNPWDTARTPGRLLRRRRRRGGRRHGADRPRQRRRRLAAHPGGLLRPGGAEAEPRTGLARARAGRRLPRPGRGAHPHGRRDRRAAGRARGLRAGRRHAGRRPRPSPSRSGRARARAAAYRRDQSTRRSRPRSTRPAGGPCARRPSCWPSLGHEVEEVDAALGGPGPAAHLHAVFGTPIALGVFFGGLVTGPRARRGAGRAALLDDLERDPRAQRGRLPGRARPAPGGLARRIVALWDDYDVVLTPRSASARCGSASSTPAATTRGTTSAARASSPPTPRSST